MARRITVDGYETLEDILADNLDVLFVGYNPSLLAVEREHYYPRNTNRFWEDLCESGFVPRVLRGHQEDLLLPSFGLGVTDVIKRPTRNIDGLSRSEFESGFRRLAAIVAECRPRIVCFNGLGLLERFRRFKLSMEPVEIWVVPSTSPRNQALRSVRLGAFRALKSHLETS
jgi:mismatch-specific thymine-DNA glycosylase